MARKPHHTPEAAQGGASVLPGLPQPQGGQDGAQGPISSDLDTLAQLRAQWEEKRKELLDQKTALDERAAALDARAAELDAREKGLEMEMQAHLGDIPSREDLAPGEFALLFVDESAALACQRYPDLDALINAAKEARRDQHMEAAIDAGLSVYWEGPTNAV